ncbi:MAG: ribosome biogenesis GTPase Der [Spirochaetales bacterium]|nr:ribosome biogenesis GTPase Der [Spirochaetales bacterium]
MTFSQSKEALPLVVIAGRPNVGKSSLFNRLLGRRKAITSPVAGVTRDAVFAEGELGGRRVLLSDTGGWQEGAGGLEGEVSRRSLDLIRRADLALLTLDLRQMTPEDESLIQALRPWTDKIILVVNKVDGPELDGEVWAFHSLGFPRVAGVSASCGRGIEELEARIGDFLAAAPEVEKAPEEALPKGLSETGEADIRIALLGKPNTGKSTLLNCLIQQERALVSPLPGTTRDVVEGEFFSGKRRFRVMDTAGIRRKSRVSENVEYYSVHRAIETIAEAEVVFLLIDAAEGLSDQDKKIASLVIKKGRGIVLTLTKMDLLDDRGNQRQAMEDRIRFFFPALDFAPVAGISAKTGAGIPELLGTGVRVWKQLNQRVETARINRALAEWVDYQALPRVQGFQYKIKYLTQVGVNPLSFAVFVNRKRGFPGAYTSYLENRIRKDLGFGLVPFHLEIKES